MRVSFLYILLAVLTVGSALGQDTNFATGPQYLMTSGSPLFARPISTPTMSLAGPPLQAGASDATGTLIPGAADQTVPAHETFSAPSVDLFPIYYGVSAGSVGDTNFAYVASESSVSRILPARFMDIGVGRITTPLALQEIGYGQTVAEAAARQKARTRSGARVYTNADIDRLRGEN
jgi:hypothetical protein